MSPSYGIPQEDQVSSMSGSSHMEADPALCSTSDIVKPSATTNESSITCAEYAHSNRASTPKSNFKPVTRAASLTSGSLLSVEPPGSPVVLSHQNTLEPQQPGICKPSLTTGLLAPEAKEEDGTVAFPGHAAWVPSGKLRRGRLRNQVQISCYADSIHGGLPVLQQFFDKHLEGVIGGMHLLPVYPSTGDGGFAPTTHQEVDPRLGGWEHVQHLGTHLDLELDLIVNHISPSSPEFQDFLAHGDTSPFAEMFMDWDKFWGPGRPTEEDLEKIRVIKPEPPVTEVTLHDGTTRRLWCTFGSQQIDIDCFSAPGRAYLTRSLRTLCEKGAKIIRLDAFGRCTKKRGTPCFMEEPEVWELLEYLNDIASEYGARLHNEIHDEFRTNMNLAAHGYWVYDFALPMLVLHAFMFQSGTVLRNWMRICPRRQYTVLDTHDGMGIDDIEGLTSVEENAELETYLLSAGALQHVMYDRKNGKYSSQSHQFDSTFFSAVSESPKAYLLARAIQFWTPGVPMVYYVGLLVGSNHPQGVALDGPRGLNRHRYSLAEAEEHLQRPVVKAFHDMCRFRNQHLAFNGEITVQEEEISNEHLLTVTRRNGQHFATLHANLRSLHFTIVASHMNDPADTCMLRFENECFTK